MRFAAENTLKEMEKDPKSKAAFDAYTNGINTYIYQPDAKCDCLLEYKLLNFRPEKWSNLRSALLLKMMAKMLSSGTERDLTYTNAKTIFSPEELKMIYPQIPMPIFPRSFRQELYLILRASFLVKPSTADSIYFNDKIPVVAGETYTPDQDNGSNNWVVAGSKTRSGAPILCNDPHLELSLPSIWYEMQLKTKNSNAYGVTLPGSPFIIIGFNDNIAWGVTNAQRDVKDYYEIKFRDASKKQYWFNGQMDTDNTRIEEIKVHGGATVYDTVQYTIFGPVMFEDKFPNDYSQG